MEKTKINQGKGPYYVNEINKGLGLFRVPESVKTMKVKRKYEWIFEDYNSSKLVLGENIVEYNLKDLRVVVEDNGDRDSSILNIVEILREFAVLFKYDYYSVKVIEGLGSWYMTGNLHSVYPRLFKSSQSEDSYNSLVGKVWDVEVPNLGEK